MLGPWGGVLMNDGSWPPTKINRKVVHYSSAASIQAIPERPHWHAELARNGLVDAVRVEPHVHKHAGRHSVWEEDSVDSESSAVSHQDRSLLDLG